MAETDEKLPVYLLWFLLRIRRHAGELDYFSKRFDGMPMDKMVVETQMVSRPRRTRLLLSIRACGMLAGVTSVSDFKEIRAPHVPEWFGS